MEGVISLSGEASTHAPLDLHVLGPMQAITAAGADVLPKLRKARALLAIIALTESQTAPRRLLAGLLWSRNDPAQALARLRDTLRSLRQSLAEGLGDIDILQVTTDRVGLRPGSVRVVLPSDKPHSSQDLVPDLDGLDPALDAWLVGARARLLQDGTQRGEHAPTSTPVQSPKRGSILGVCVLQPIGPQADDFLAFALTEEIAAALCRIRGLLVISGASVAASVAGQRDLRGELGLDFLLQGSLQWAAGRLRISMKLVDAVTSAVCWTANFDYGHSDLFHVQQDVAALVAAGLEPELPLLAAERIKRSGSTSDGAYELILRAISRIHLLDRRSFMEAGDLLGRAIELEPEYSPAYSWLALWHVFLVGQGWARDPRASTARAGEVAEHAVMLDPNDARGLAIAGHVRAFLHRRLDEAIPLHERAIAINPSLPLAWHLSGVAQAYRGNLAEARRRIEQCRRLAPRDPHSFFADGAAIIVALLSRNHEEAALIGRRVTQLHPRFSAAYKPYLAALGHLGEQREAALIYRRLLQLEPDFTTRAFRTTSPFALREHTEHYAAGLSLAGVP